MKPLFLLLTLCSILSCNYQAPELFSPEKKAFVDSVINKRLPADSLDILLSQFINEKNDYGIIQAHIQKAQNYHNNSDYNKSLEEYKKALVVAERFADTLNIMTTLNAMGTNLRRLGAMGKSSSYFYKTLTYFHLFSDNTGPQAKKIRLISLNSLGNVNNTLGNTEAADSLFHTALQGSLELGDFVGCAVNSANIGLVFERKNQLDSAWHYQRMAMEYNKQANYKLGIAITHVNYGKLYEKQGDYENAMREYQLSMDETRNMNNRWQWPMSGTKWIGLKIWQGNYADVRDDLDRAEKYAHEIRSVTHLSDVARLNYLYYKAKGDYLKALEYFETHKLYSDSLRNTRSADETHNLRLQYERENSKREMSAMQKEYELKQQDQYTWIKFSAVILILAIAAILFLVYALRMRTRSQQTIKQIDEMRSSFFTNITHEFRTPLTVIMGMAEQLKNKNSNEAEAQTIVRQSETLLDMVNQLLDIAKVKSSVDHSRWCHDDVAAYIGMTSETYRDYFAVKGVDIIFTSDKRNIFMDFVPEYFNKILRNLLSNSLKYTLKGGKVTIAISSDDTNFTLTITDTGEGIKPGDLPHIFEEFYQGDQSHAEAGTGIGLAFVSKMIENMGGHITACNLSEGGARFCITLPLRQRFEVKERFSATIQAPLMARRSKAEAISGESSVDEETLTTEEQNDKPSILIIEDNTDVRFYIGSLLDNRYHIHFASNGEEGISRANDFMPDLIITDLMMPVMDGHAVCRAIRESDILNHIPIIVITAKATDEDKQRALVAGADAYLYKPFNIEELNIRVTKLLEQRSLLREKYSKAMLEGVQDEVELSTDDHRFLNRLISVVYERIADATLNPDTIAEHICMSRSQLNRKIRNITGFSIAAYVLHVCIEKAKRMLLTDETPISEIAEQCGFEDSSYFSRVFKQVHKVTPSQFRKTANLHKNPS